MSATINEALLLGDGAGKPLGLLHEKSGVPVCETSASTPPGQFSWQDLILLKYEIPMQWQTGASYLMNQRTFALLLSMSDAGGRPMWSSLPGEEPGFRLAGNPVIIASQMPDVSPGSTPVAYGNFKKPYTIVERRQPTLEIDNYSGGWCRLFKFSARIGGSVTCSNALRLLRVR
jgi:HK97 family phage major capsid protein